MKAESNHPNEIQRKIIHIDMDAFFASVEQRDNPELLGKPVVVGGKPDSRGVVCAASYEARQYGVKSAMASSKAYKLCPSAIFIRPNMEKYSQASQKLRQIFLDYTDLIEPLSLDEAYLDVTVNKKGIAHATTIAREIKRRVKKELNLTASCGVAGNKLLAKIASDYNKTDGLCIIRPEDAKNFMANLELRKIPGVGKVTCEKLKSIGIARCQDILNYPKDQLIIELGKFGLQLYQYAQGIDNRPVTVSRERHSLGTETTFQADISDINLIKEVIERQIEKLSLRLYEKDLKGKTITLKIKYHDFTTITRSKTLSHATNDPNIISYYANQLIYQTLTENKKIRLAGITVSKFLTQAKDSYQYEFPFIV